MKFKRVVNEHFKSSGTSKITKTKKLSEGMERVLYESADVLYKGAMNAYDRGDEDWFYDRTDDELVDLWVSCKVSETNPYGAAYDDEVYDAINDRPNSRELFDAADEIAVRHFDDATLSNVYKRYFNTTPQNDMSRDEIEDKVIDAIKNYKYGSTNESFTHFSFKSGSNPYIAKNDKEANRIIKKYGDKAKKVKDGFYEIDDSELNKDMFSVDLDEAYGGEKHPDQDAIEQALMNITGTTKVEFDYRPNDGVYKVPENHLVILPFCRDGDIFGDGFEYFRNRREWKNKILSTLRRMGWTQEDPMEDNDSYLYLVMRKKSSPNMNEGKQLNEGPGAGYTIKGTITNVHLNNVKECKFSYSDDYGDYYEAELDATATFEDIEAHSYYYGGEVGDAPISIIRCVVNSEQEPTDEDIIGALSGAKVDVVIGGGWSHSTFDGFIEASVEDGELDTYYDVLDRVLFEITNKETVSFIDSYVTGDNIETLYEIVDEDGYAVDAFDTKEEAIEYAKKNGCSSVREIEQTTLPNGDVDVETFDTVWEDDMEESDTDDDSIE